MERESDERHGEGAQMREDEEFVKSISNPPDRENGHADPENQPYESP